MDELPITTLVAALGFLIGGVMGVTARYANFCTLGAIADVYVTSDSRRLRAWALAIALDLLLTQAMDVAGIIHLRQAIYLLLRLRVDKVPLDNIDGYRPDDSDYDPTAQGFELVEVEEEIPAE